MVDLNRKGAWRQLRVRTFETAFCVEGGLVVPGSVEWVGRVIGSQRQADAGCQIGRNRHAEPGSDGAAEDAFKTECRHTRWARVEMGLHSQPVFVIEFTVEERVQLVDRVAAIAPDTRKRTGRKGGIGRGPETGHGAEDRL